MISAEVNILSKGSLYQLGSIDQIPPGEGREFVVCETKIAVFRARNGEVYATQANCPHREGALADGILGGSTIICPMHGRKFDMRTGMSQTGECGLDTYSVEITDAGEILLTY